MACLDIIKMESNPTSIKFQLDVRIHKTLDDLIRTKYSRYDRSTSIDQIPLIELIELIESIELFRRQHTVNMFLFQTRTKQPADVTIAYLILNRINTVSLNSIQFQLQLDRSSLGRLLPTSTVKIHRQSDITCLMNLYDLPPFPPPPPPPLPPPPPSHFTPSLKWIR